jgi:hypothetical protein
MTQEALKAPLRHGMASRPIISRANTVRVIARATATAENHETAVRFNGKGSNDWELGHSSIREMKAGLRPSLRPSLLTLIRRLQDGMIMMCSQWRRI